MKTPPIPEEVKPLSLLEALRGIKRRPMMWIGDHPQNRVSIWHLLTFIVGFQTGSIGRGGCLEGDSIIDAFTFWVCLRFHVPDGPNNWASLLWKQCGEDGEAAFRMFNELFEEYVKERAEIGPETIKERFIEMMKNLPTKGKS